MALTQELRRTAKSQGPAQPQRHHLADAPDSLRLIAEYSRHQQWRNFSPRTIEMRRSVLRRFSAFNGERLLFASSRDIEAWLQSCPLSPRSIALYLEHLHTFYVWVIREGLAEVDPTVRIARPKQRRYLARPISEDHLAAACREADVRMLAMLALAAYAGLRCCEIATLRGEDIYWDREPPLLHVREGKGGRERMLPLSRKAELALRAYDAPTFGPVFAKRSGEPFKASSVSRMIGNHLHGLGIQATAHMLRHRFGSVLYAKSLDLRLTQEMLGHASPNTTQVYVAFSPDRAAAVVRDL